MGIILNDGVRARVVRIDSLHFAADTPYETQVINDPAEGKRVMPLEVARALRGALSQVVDAGTAKRVAGSFKLDDGTPLAMGGKTGTGDNRIEAIGAGGRCSVQGDQPHRHLCVLYRRSTLRHAHRLRPG